MSSNLGAVEYSSSRTLKEMLGKPLFCRRIGLGLVMPLGQFPPNVVVGLLATVVFGYVPVTCT